jgi:hypothetical protein
MTNRPHNPLSWFSDVRHARENEDTLILSETDERKYVILFAFNMIDIQVQFLFAEKYLEKGCENILFDEFREMVYPKFQIREKIKTLKHFNMPANFNKILTSINEVRNGVAHGYGVNHKKFLYPDEKGKNTLTDDKTFDQFINDCEAIYDWLYTQYMDILKIAHKEYYKKMENDTETITGIDHWLFSGNI